MNILVTGASSGFGYAIAEVFAEAGHNVIACARRFERLQALQNKWGKRIYPLVLDVQETAAISKALEQLPEAWRVIDVLVNNAGLSLDLSPAHQCQIADWETMINTNVHGLVAMTHAIVPQMVQRQRGHIINIGSVAGTYPYPGGNVYGATKAFVAQFSLNLRADLVAHQVRVTNIEPGLCETEFSMVRFKGNAERADAVYANVEALSAKDIADTVFWVAMLPPHVNVNRLEIMPTAQSFSGLHIERRS